MRELKRENSAPFVLIYSEPGVGKTVTLLRTVPGPIYFISTESGIWESIDVLENEGEKFEGKIVTPDSQEQIYELLSSITNSLLSGKKPLFKAIIFDSASTWMNCDLQTRLENDRFELKYGNIKKENVRLVQRTHTTFDEVGSTNSEMRRLTKMFEKITDLGVAVYFTAHLQENPKFNSALAAAPAFIFKDYNLILRGCFSYIGLLTTRFDQSGERVFPPTISFESNDDARYMAKWRGIRKNPTGPCNFSKIFKGK